MHWDLDFMNIHETDAPVFERKGKLGVDEPKRNPWAEKHRNGGKP